MMAEPGLPGVDATIPATQETSDQNWTDITSNQTGHKKFTIFLYLYLFF